MTKITSFTRDHTKILPGIYLSAVKRHKKFGTVTKFDLRFCRPNREKIPPKALHSLEHLLAIYFSEYFGNDYIDLSPMGCRTGYYLILFGKQKVADLPDFKKILAFARKQKRAPFATATTCGSAMEHDYRGAVRVLEKFVKKLYQ